MSQPFDREAHEAEMREFEWRCTVVEREIAEALHHWFRVLCPEEDLARHTPWLDLVAKRTAACLTAFYGGSDPWYQFSTAPEALVLALYGRPERLEPFQRLTIEHEPSCAGYYVDVPEKGIRLALGYCQCHLRVRREA